MQSSSFLAIMILITVLFINFVVFCWRRAKFLSEKERQVLKLNPRDQVNSDKSFDELQKDRQHSGAEYGASQADAGYGASKRPMA